MTTYEPVAGSPLGDGFVKILVSNDHVIGLFSRSALAASSEIDGLPALDGTDPSWVMVTEAPTVDVDYPPSGTEGRVETFTHSLPAGFAIVDHMAPMERGVVLGAFASDNWITLAFAHATSQACRARRPTPSSPRRPPRRARSAGGVRVVGSTTSPPTARRRAIRRR